MISFSSFLLFPSFLICPPPLPISYHLSLLAFLLFSSSPHLFPSPHLSSCHVFSSAPLLLLLLRSPLLPLLLAVFFQPLIFILISFLLSPNLPLPIPSSNSLLHSPSPSSHPSFLLCFLLLPHPSSFHLSSPLLSPPLSPSLLSTPLCRVAVLVAGDNPCHGGWLGIRTSSLFTAGRMIQRLVAQAPAAAALCWISNMFEWDKRDSLPHRTPPPNPYTAVKWAGPAAPHLDPCWVSLSLSLSLPNTCTHCLYSTCLYTHT